MIAHAQTTAFESMLDELLDGTVPAIDARALEKQLSESTAPILLDAREPDEYAVSHLQGARNVGFEDFDLDTLSDIDKDAPIVIYCSVGYRSEKIGEKLQRAGFKNVVNLWGEFSTGPINNCHWSTARRRRLPVSTPMTKTGGDG